MKKWGLVLAALLAGWGAAGQFEVGQVTITFNDPTRSGGFGSGGGTGRQIQTEIYYPVAPGSNGVIAEGTFPLVTFGHGFVMVWSAYSNLWQALVPRGYIMAFPRTEGGFSPNHLDFALDLALVNERMLALSTAPSSIFFERVSQNTAIMGHSMGGGCAVTAAANNPLVTAYAGLAPAETNNVSAIASAESVVAASLVLSGSSDGVTPPNVHHLPIYNALNADCKHFVSITGGAHCYFNNSNFNCDTGEFFASSGISVSRALQQQITYDYLNSWLDAVLKQDCEGLQAFEELLENDERTTVEVNCDAGFTPSPCPCTGDFNADGTITSADLLVFLTDFGCASNCLADLDGDGITGAADLLIFLGLFGNNCP